MANKSDRSWGQRWWRNHESLVLFECYGTHLDAGGMARCGESAKSVEYRGDGVGGRRAEGSRPPQKLRASAAKGVDVDV